MAPAAAGYFRKLTRKLTEDVDQLDAEEMAESSVLESRALPLLSVTRRGCHIGESAGQVRQESSRSS